MSGVVLWAWHRPYWQLSASVAVAATVVWLVTRRMQGAPQERIAAFCRDLAIAAGVFATYQHTVHYAHTHVIGAEQHALDVWHAEQWLHLPSELDVQNAVLGHPWLVQFLNGYYGGVHLPLMICFVLWVLWFHRPDYPAVRNVIALSTLACVFIQMVPVAPPRLMSQLGFVDTALAYGQSVYSPGGEGIAGQLAAMPSIHVAWAAIIAWYAVRISSSPWRWIFVVHFFMTLLVITATANHWWLDGVVALGIVALALLAQRGIESWSAARRDRLADEEPAVPATAQ